VWVGFFNLKQMLHIYKGVDNNLIFTGLELATISNPKYLFIFTSATEDSVIFVGTNISTEDRYQKVLVLKSVFKNEECGTWRYKIREQASATNKKEALSGAIVEEGFMYLHQAEECEDAQYDEQCNEFKTYSSE
jgi:hypothetical protein